MKIFVTGVGVVSAIGLDADENPAEVRRTE